MNLQQTIADLEKQAANYTAAANALRALVQSDESASGETSEPQGTSRRSRRRAGGGAGTKTSKTAKKRSMSPEARARIGAATKARHEQRKQQAQEGQEG